MNMALSLRQAWQMDLQRHRLLAVVRVGNPELAHGVALALAAGGIRLLEITWDTPAAAMVIQQLRQNLPHCQIGSGTLLSLEDMNAAIAAGSQFCFSPHFSVELCQRALAAAVPYTPGCMTPTEVLMAWQQGG